MIILLKILGVFILIYLTTFVFTLTVTHIASWVKQLCKNKDLIEENIKKRPQNIIKHKVDKKRVWNKILGVWEVDE